MWKASTASLLCWLTAIALGGVCYYLDALAPYRDIRGFPKDSVEDYCLWLAAMTAAVGIVASAAGWVAIWRSGGRGRGRYWLSLGMALNFLTLLAILFALFVRELAKAA